jgi:agmatine deiminase
LEGGAIDVNGKGTLIATKECLLSKVQERNPGLSREKLEIILSESLNVKNFIWLNKGIVGDDTHGHIDDITRFFDDDKIFTAIEYQKNDENFSALNENLKILKKSRNHLGKQNTIVEIPMPSPLIIDDTRVPASYLNFYIANKIVLLPIFEDKNDDIAFQILEKHFKDRKIVPINCRDLIWGFGAIHCMTQQEPAI